jgi:hypothetical protein
MEICTQCRSRSRSSSGLSRWPMPRVLGDLTGGQSSDNRAGVGADVGRKIVKFKAEVEVNLPEDLNKYTGTPEGIAGLLCSRARQRCT